MAWPKQPNPLQRFSAEGDAAASYGSVPVKMDLSGKFRSLVFAGRAEDALAAAHKYCHSLFEQTPELMISLAKRGAARTAEELKALMAEGTEAMCTFAATLGMLDLVSPCDVTGFDTAKCSWALRQLRTTHNVQDVLGTICVNASMWDGAKMENLELLDHEAEVDAVCLAIYWHSEAEHAEVREALVTACRDLVFNFVQSGRGCKILVEKYKRYEAEDAKRAVLGLSAWRKCRLLVSLSDAARAEGRCATAPAEAERMIALFTEEHIQLKGWNVDTMRRYLAVGRRLDEPELHTLRQKWELVCERATYVDGITALRNVVAVATTSADLHYLLQTLFREQVCGIRGAQPGSDKRRGHHAANTAQNIMRALLLRRALFVHLKKTFPKHSDILQPFDTPQFYKDTYGMEESGNRGGDEDVNDAEAEEETEDVVEDVSTYESRTPLLKLCLSLAKNKMEIVLATMAKDVEGAVLDLTHPAATPITQQLAWIKTLYDQDFPQEKLPANVGVVEHACQDNAGGSESVSVKVEKVIATEEAASCPYLLSAVWSSRSVRYTRGLECTLRPPSASPRTELHSSCTRSYFSSCSLSSSSSSSSFPLLLLIPCAATARRSTMPCSQRGTCSARPRRPIMSRGS